jgi:alanine racemase
MAIHVVVDTGVGRMGALPDGAAAVLRAVKSAEVLTLESVSSHFPCADEDADFTTRQEQEFRRLTAQWQAEFGPFRTHIANSAAILHYPRLPHETVRAGLMLYGLSPLPEHQHLLRPALTWKARVCLVRKLPAGWGVSHGRSFITPHPMTVAAITAGYGDGYPRQVSGKGAAVLVHGRRCPILGRVTMDQILIDVSALDPPPVPGEEAVLLGPQGDASISAREVASLAGTIPWHIFTGITDRTARLCTQE